MPWFAYKKTHAGYAPQVLFNPPYDGSGKVSWEEFHQHHKINDAQAMKGIAQLSKIFPLRVAEKDST